MNLTAMQNLNAEWLENLVHDDVLPIMLLVSVFQQGPITSSTIIAAKQFALRHSISKCVELNTTQHYIKEFSKGT